MNPEIFVLGATIVIQLLGVTYVYGKLTQRVSDGAMRTKENTEQLETHRSRLDGHDVQIGKLQAWRDGYDAARAIHKADSNG